MKNRILKNSIVLIIYVVIIIIAMFLFVFLNKKVDPWESNNYFYVILYLKPILFITLGILFSFEGVVKDFRKSGNWRFNTVRFLIVVFPLGILSFNHALYYSNTIARISHSLSISFNIPTTLLTAIQLLTGFLIITCFSKTEDDYGTI